MKVNGCFLADQLVLTGILAQAMTGVGGMASWVRLAACALAAATGVRPSFLPEATIGRCYRGEVVIACDLYVYRRKQKDKEMT